MNIRWRCGVHSSLYRYASCDAIHMVPAALVGRSGDRPIQAGHGGAPSALTPALRAGPEVDGSPDGTCSLSQQIEFGDKGPGWT